MPTIPKSTTLVFLGRAGSGKDTQIDFLLGRADFVSAVKTDTGGRFRELVKNDSALWRKAKKVLDQGARQPDWFAFTLWLFLVGEKVRDEEILVSSGSPRSLREARLIDEALGFMERPSAVAVFIETGPPEAKKRLLLRGRHDDNDPEIENRFAWFETDVLPAVEYYRKEGRLVELNGEQSPEEVFKELGKKLENYFA
ncbi:MAG: nucleoside monophosphate kinase [bacterium]|nr:nucleoside monophosphate kinase [bacterium]